MPRRAHPPAHFPAAPGLEPGAALRDFVHDETATIQVDSRENFLSLTEFDSVYTPSVLQRLVRYELPQEQYGVILM